jgi:hypothetical protein
MSDPTPNCIIAVQFDEVESRFSYHCENSSRGWEVYPNGNIYPPLLHRIVKFRLKGDSSARFAGFQISSEPLGLPPSDPWPCMPPGVIQYIPPSLPPPPVVAPLTELTFNLGDQQGWFYRLAVVVGDSEPIWDDPKIHDDGTE